MKFHIVEKFKKDYFSRIFLSISHSLNTRKVSFFCSLCHLMLLSDCDILIVVLNCLLNNVHRILTLMIITLVFSLTVSEQGGDNQLPQSQDDDLPVIIILVVCVVGIFLLALNVGLILFFVRRRKKRLESRYHSCRYCQINIPKN